MKRTLKFLLPCFLHSEFDKRINLGLLYLNGKGVARDYGEARRLFEQGAAMGNAACMNGLGAIYNEGDGVRRDVKPPGSGSRRRQRWAIPKRRKTCGECANEGGAAGRQHHLRR